LKIRKAAISTVENGPSGPGSSAAAQGVAAFPSPAFANDQNVYDFDPLNFKLE
jgi:hypothetical protein